MKPRKPPASGQPQPFAEYMAEIRKRVPSDASDYDWLVRFEYTRRRSVEDAAMAVRVLLALSTSDPVAMLRLFNEPQAQPAGAADPELPAHLDPLFQRDENASRVWRKLVRKQLVHARETNFSGSRGDG